MSLDPLKILFSFYSYGKLPANSQLAVNFSLVAMESVQA
jgi:hypothetical protein